MAVERLQRKPTGIDLATFFHHLDQLVGEHKGKLEWRPIVTSEMGRLSASEENLKLVSSSLEGLGMGDTHFHLIGNGQMVNEWKEGLGKAGVPAKRVTIEQYFNHKAESNPESIENIASVVSESCVVEA